LTADLVEKVRTAAAASEIIRAVHSVRRDGGRGLALGDVPLRALYRDEIDRLEQLGNSCPDWSRVLVADGFDCQKIRNSSFQGDIVLGRLTGHVLVPDGVELPAGIDHVTLSNCVIGHDVLLRDVNLLSKYVVAEGVVLIGCGRIVCDAPTPFSNGAELAIGPESGGREIAVYAEMDLPTATALTRAEVREQIGESYAQAVDDYRSQATCPRGIIRRRAVIQGTPRVRNTYVGPHARIDGATSVAETTLLSNAEEPARIEAGAAVSGSILQWGSTVATMAIVERSLLMEHAHVEAHASVSASILGPNTAVAKGEVASSLLGPFVSMHHQSLLIATVWPDGKGNVSYGANVGANHTSKAPDQEFWPGEGVFLGLGINVKFPADLRRSPYSILAAGVTTLPQRVAFPFSLINSPSARYPGVSPAYNEIIPAWVLSDNLYALRRNETKFQCRDRAQRHQFDFRILRPDIIDLMRDAWRRLEEIRQPKDVYTEQDIDGLGKNYLLETHRQAAIEAYRFFAKYYALLRLKDEVEAALTQGAANGSLSHLLTMRAKQPEWEHARQILCNEFEITDVIVGLRQLIPMLEQFGLQVERSKAKDDERGPRIFEDYAAVHIEAANDPIVRQTWEDMQRLQVEVEQLLATLADDRSRSRLEKSAGRCRSGQS
jgi:hypothetical protein